MYLQKLYSAHIIFDLLGSLQWKETRMLREKGKEESKVIGQIQIQDFAATWVVASHYLKSDKIWL